MTAHLLKDGFPSFQWFALDRWVALYSWLAFAQRVYFLITTRSESVGSLTIHGSLKMRGFTLLLRLALSMWVYLSFAALNFLVQNFLSQRILGSNLLHRWI